MIPPDVTLITISLAIVAIAAVVQGATGMGFGQISAAGLIWTMPDMLPAIVVLMALAVSSVGAFREMRGVDTEHLSISILGRILGTAIAVPLLVLVSDHQQGFSLLFGVLLLLSVLLSVAKIKPALSYYSLAGGGFASGLMGTITAVGAPPMGLVYQDQDAATARPTLNAFFAIGALFSLLALWYSGRFSLNHVIMAIYLAPGFIAGVYMSKYLHKYVDHRFRYIVLGFSFISAVCLIAVSLD